MDLDATDINNGSSFNRSHGKQYGMNIILATFLILFTMGAALPSNEYGETVIVESSGDTFEFEASSIKFLNVDKSLTNDRTVILPNGGYVLLKNSDRIYKVTEPDCMSLDTIGIHNVTIPPNSKHSFFGSIYNYRSISTLNVNLQELRGLKEVSSGPITYYKLFVPPSGYDYWGEPTIVSSNRITKVDGIIRMGIRVDYRLTKNAVVHLRITSKGKCFVSKIDKVVESSVEYFRSRLKRKK